MTRYSWTIKTAADAADIPLGEVYLSLHGLTATTHALKLPPREYTSASVESGVLEVEGDLGELQTGSLRAVDSTRKTWPVEWVQILNLSDGRTWTAPGGVCDTGSCPLLQFERTRGPTAIQPMEKKDEQILPPALQTFEIYGMQSGRVVPLSQILRMVSGIKKLVPGCRIFVTDAGSQGFGLAGEPGRWEDLYPGVNPAAHGLDPDKPVLASDGARGWVVDAHYLAMLFGAEWRQVVYGN